MKSVKDRKYTDAFRTNAVSQVLEGGHRQAEVARRLEISFKTLANRVGKARRSYQTSWRAPLKPRRRTANGSPTSTT